MKERDRKRLGRPLQKQKTRTKLLYGTYNQIHDMQISAQEHITGISPNSHYWELLVPRIVNYNVPKEFLH